MRVRLLHSYMYFLWGGLLAYERTITQSSPFPVLPSSFFGSFQAVDQPRFVEHGAWSKESDFAWLLVVAVQRGSYLR